MFLLQLMSPASFAAGPQWHDTSLTLLYGDGFEVDPEEQTTLTLEHASGWGFGDLFLFMDFTHYHDSRRSDGFYGEFSPRFSYGIASNQWTPLSFKLKQ